jgi:hypothetical protein
MSQEHTVGRKLYELGNEEWDIPKLRIALETIISGEKTFENFEVEQFFPSIGQRVMCLNARKVYRPGNKIQLILLAIEDVTERVRLEREHAVASERIGTLLQELRAQHRCRTAPALPTGGSLRRTRSQCHRRAMPTMAVCRPDRCRSP